MAKIAAHKRQAEEEEAAMAMANAAASSSAATTDSARLQPSSADAIRKEFEPVIGKGRAAILQKLRGKSRNAALAE
jgi:hypothetical protein